MNNLKHGVHWLYLSRGGDRVRSLGKTNNSEVMAYYSECKDPELSTMFVLVLVLSLLTSSLS